MVIKYKTIYKLKFYQETPLQKKIAGKSQVYANISKWFVQSIISPRNFVAYKDFKNKQHQ